MSHLWECWYCGWGDVWRGAPPVASTFGWVGGVLLLWLGMALGSSSGVWCGDVWVVTLWLGPVLRALLLGGVLRPTTAMYYQRDVVRSFDGLGCMEL